jgi:hypothetical protein
MGGLLAVSFEDGIEIWRSINGEEFLEHLASTGFLS